MIKEKDWKNWVNDLLKYAKVHYPDIEVTEEKIIDICFKSLRTVYMEQIIIDIGEEIK